MNYKCIVRAMKDNVYLALIVLFSSISTSLQAANIHYPLFFFNNTAEYRRGIVVEGDIVAGAHIKFQDIVETIFDPDFEDKQLVAVYLFSNGGSVDEALKIGRLVRRLKLAAFKPGAPEFDIRA